MPISKIGTAKKHDIKTVEANARIANPSALIIKADLEMRMDKPEIVRGKNVIVIEDGPTLTHGQMRYGAGMIMAKKCNSKIVDASRYAVGSIRSVYKKYPHLGKILPAMGYSARQMKELEDTINRAKCDAVIEATPSDLSRLLKINKPVCEVHYSLKPSKTLDKILDSFAKRVKK